jgi:Tfp pilus assembly protein PilX
MKTYKDRQSGSALIMVLAFTLLAAVVAAMMVSAMGTRLRTAQDQLRVEKAFYIAEAGAERAASYIANGGALPATIEGSIDGSEYRVNLLIESEEADSTLEGAININPNNSPSNAFFAVLPDGSQINREDLHQNRADYNGEASTVNIQPKGGGQQNTLLVDGAVYPLQNSQTYTFVGDLQIAITNDNRNSQGKAVGQWWIALEGTNIAISASSNPLSLRNQSFKIYSRGTVDGVRRQVTISGLRQVSWAKYALWYYDEALELWMVGGEFFEGPVYSRPQMRFHTWQIAALGQARFFERAWSSAAGIWLLDGTVNPIFDEGLVLSAPVETMASVDFDDLRDDAALVLDGATSITLSNDVMYVTNARRSWSDEAVPVPADGLVYVRTVTTGAESTWPGDLAVRAPDGLAGRLTLVAERDILVDNHVRYANNPTNDPTSTDALGLTAGRHTRVTTAAPDNVDIYAHIICRTGGFGVDEYNYYSHGQRGTLNVYGGIVNQIRNPVGTTAGTGYLKNYVFDQRFTLDPPPYYPTLADQFQWREWDG